MGKLTLKDCLAQERGWEGRLFKIPDDAKPTKEEFEKTFGWGAYRVLNRKSDRITIQVYIASDSRKSLSEFEVEEVPVTERENDEVIESSTLLDYYAGIGRALQAPSAAAALI